MSVAPVGLTASVCVQKKTYILFHSILTFFWIDGKIWFLHTGQFLTWMNIDWSPIFIFWMVFVHVWEKHILPQFERNFWLCKFAFWIYRVVICHLSIVICHFLVLRVSQCLFLDTWNSLLISFANFHVCGFSIALHTAIFPHFFFLFLNSFFFLLKFLTNFLFSKFSFWYRGLSCFCIWVKFLIKF